MEKHNTIDENSNMSMDELHKFLSFKISDDNFGLSILKVKEIIEYQDLTEVPMMPNFVCGAINLRGHVVPVIDLSVRLGRESQGIGRRTCVIITEVGSQNDRMEVGLLVDAVNEVMDIHPRDIDPAPSFRGSIRTEFIHGMGKIDEKFIILLDIENILSLQDLEILDNEDTPDKASAQKAIDPASVESGMDD